MYRAVTVTLALVCPSCGGQTPVGELAESLKCASCQTAIAMPWGALFDVQLRGSSYALGDVVRGLAAGQTLTGASTSVRLAVEITAPRCVCGRAFTIDELTTFSRIRPTVPCASCGVPMPGRRPPDALATAYPTTMFVIGEGATGASASTGVVIHCGDCGAPLGDSLTCSYCGSVNQRPATAGTDAPSHRLGVVFKT